MSIDVNDRLSRILTQYRESTLLIGLIKAYLSTIAESFDRIKPVSTVFDIDYATGENLTIAGKWLGWSRTHCVCEVQPVFGFECEGDVLDIFNPVAGFCQGDVTFETCSSNGLGEVTINDDELYRKTLYARRAQMKGDFSRRALTESVNLLFGDNAEVVADGDGRVVIAPGRDLTATEVALLQVYPRVMPVAPGIEIRFHFYDSRVFGFGEGWGGFAEPQGLSSDSRTGKLFGFACEQFATDMTIGGFCEEWVSDGARLVNETGFALVTENGAFLTTGPLTSGADIECLVSAPTLCEINTLDAC